MPKRTPGRDTVSTVQENNPSFMRELMSRYFREKKAYPATSNGPLWTEMLILLFFRLQRAIVADMPISIAYSGVFASRGMIFFFCTYSRYWIQEQP